ncbi:MAG: adenosylmethionine--8-amino-7-oxononanoate transaminase [Magnetospirillum sp. WYHS-4]
MVDNTLDLDRRHVWHPFTQAKTAPLPVPIRSAVGAVLTAEDGRQYLDLISSWWVTLHGHAHPVIAAAIADQARTLEQVIFAGFTHAPAARLAARLAHLLPEDLERVFFSDDGSTAVEVALKIALQHARNKGEERRTRFLAFAGGYHGDTVGAMSAGTGSGFFEAYRPLFFDVRTLPYPATWDGDDEVEAKERAALAAVEAALEEQGAETCALIAEPLVQGASGMRMVRPEFLRAVVARVRAAGVLAIFDEVMTGFGRTGALFACGKAAVTPDIICLSKGLTGGFLPLSATVTREGVYEAFLGETFDRALVHGHSFTANPLGCRAALASLDLLEAPETPVAWTSIEAIHRQRLADLPAAAVRRRVLGTIAAFEVDGGGEGYDAAIGPRLRAAFLEQGLLMRPLGNVVYMMPPYCITENQLHRAYDSVGSVLRSSLL